MLFDPTIVFIFYIFFLPALLLGYVADHEVTSFAACLKRASLAETPCIVIESTGL